MILFPDLIFALGALLCLLLARRFDKNHELKQYGVAFGMWFLFNQGVARPAVIPSGSMEPSLVPGDRVVVDVLDYQLHGALRGDVLVFRSPEGPKVLCKRLIGLPGEQVAVRQGRILINGKPLERDFTAEASLNDFGPALVPQGHYFMMGDHRNNSYDSRYFGPVEQELCVGKVRCVWWPLNRIGGVKH